MIKTFADKPAAAIFKGLAIRQFSGTLARMARKKLKQIDAAIRIEDLRIPPGNRLEKLSGDRENQWSIRINDQWRICFVFEDTNAYEVEIVDYH
ncbi:MAG: type II toxin-antitoxin system RelE/ParE family toxin [Zoogloeaceae bacterium]|nr:type II toxin-antitoxin system RelE/ParE family toxin [Zoogloeaceae bacterium]